MDTSKKYIKMCEKAQQLQKKWKPKVWDCVYYNHPHINEKGIDLIESINKKFKEKHKSYNGIVYYIYLINHSYWPQEYLVWMPRQDQLQEMMEFPLHKLLWAFEEWCEKFSDTHLLIDKSMEQLWLAFVMEEKYKKIWDDEKEVWVNKNMPKI